jgi:hypothetical protein
VAFSLDCPVSVAKWLKSGTKMRRLKRVKNRAGGSYGHATARCAPAVLIGRQPCRRAYNHRASAWSSIPVRKLWISVAWTEGGNLLLTGSLAERG